MKEMKFNFALLMIFVLFMLSFLLVTLTGCNYQMADTVYSFDRAIINIGDKTIEVEVKAWRDFEDGDQVQIVAPDGTVYLTDTTRCVLIKDGKGGAEE